MNNEPVDDFGSPVVETEQCDHGAIPDDCVPCLRALAVELSRSLIASEHRLRWLVALPGALDVEALAERDPRAAALIRGVATKLRSMTDAARPERWATEHVVLNRHEGDDNGRP